MMKMKDFSCEELKALAVELPDEVNRYKMAGDFEGAAKAIDRWMDKSVGEAMKTRLLYETYILQKLPKEFPDTEEEVIRKFRETLPDFSMEDLRRAEEENLAEWILVDGRKHYIHNLIRNLSDKEPEIRRRLGKADEKNEAKRLLLEAIHEMQEKGEKSVRIHLKTAIRLKEECVEPGMKIRAHLPLPAELFHTSDVKLLDHAPGKVTVDAPDARWRSICFEDTLEENRTFFAEYAYTVKAKYVDLWKEELPEAETKAASDGKPGEEYLSEQYPHIRFTPYLRSLASEIVGTEKRPVEIARRIYDYVTKNVQYSYMRNYSIQTCIPEYCATNLRGDCGVQALLFITLCRIAGVPAGWESGLYSNPVSLGAHDWAMFYAEPYGWLYADPSFGGSAYAAGDENRRRFYFGNLEPFRMAANHAFQQKFTVKKEFLPIDTCDNQTGEMECETCGFTEEELEVTKEIISVEML